MMKTKHSLKAFETILAGLDALAAQVGGEAAEDLEDLNAEFEDALLLLSELKPEDPEAAAEFRDAMEDLSALAGDYLALGEGIPDVEALARRLRMTAEAAQGEG